MLRYFKKSPGVFLSMIILSALFVSCVLVFTESTEDAFNRRIEERISAGDTEIYLHDLTEFDWDKVCYLTFSEDYHFDDREISNLVRRNYSGKLPQKRCDTDKYNALLFLADGGEVLINVDRCSLKFDKASEDTAGNVCFGKETYFYLTAHPANESWIDLNFKEK